MAEAKLEARSLDAPHETRSFVDNGHLDLVTLGSVTVGRGVFEPGWQWSKHIKPIAGTDSCQASHIGYVLTGQMKVVMDNGDELTVGPGDAFVMPPGHDAWIVGDETCTLLDFSGFAEYAKPH
jgi:quercetin dioxygenase-like cupin family protein